MREVSAIFRILKKDSNDCIPRKPEKHKKPQLQRSADSAPFLTKLRFENTGLAAPFLTKLRFENHRIGCAFPDKAPL